MLQIIKKMNVLLDKKQKRTMVGLIILMVISAFYRPPVWVCWWRSCRSSLIRRQYSTAE